MSILYLGYETAQWYWEHYADNVLSLDELPGRACLDDCARDAQSVSDLAHGTVFWDRHLDVLTNDRSGMAGNITFHRMVYEYPRRSFVQVAPQVFVASPVLSFVQMAQRLSFARTLLYGYALCGSFAVDESFAGGLVERARLVSSKYFESSIRPYAGHHGAKAALTAAQYVQEGSASPRESKLSIALTLPLCRGGKGLPLPKLNKRIDIPHRYAWSGGRRYYVADLYWDDGHVTVEYDSDIAHAGRTDIYRDSDKRNTLMDMGYSPLCFTSIQLDDPDAFDHAAEALRRKLGVRRRPLPKDYQRKVDELRTELGLSVFSYVPFNMRGTSWLDAAR